MAVRHKVKGIPCGAVHGSAFSEHYICTRNFKHKGDHVQAVVNYITGEEKFPIFINSGFGLAWVLGASRYEVKKRWHNNE